MASAVEHSVWQPILTASLANRAREVIELIADRLRDLPSDRVTKDSLQAHQDASCNDPSLAGGRAGLAVLYAYLAQAWSRDQDREQAFRLLEEAIDLTAATHTRPSLYAGFTGVAWVAEHLRTMLLDQDEDDPNEAIDEALLEYLGQSPWRDDYDLVHGLVGFGVYALERLPRPVAAKCLTCVVEHLGDIARCDSEGITWLSTPDLLPPHQRAQSPQGHYNLGVAHGMPAVIALLGRVCATGIAVNKARPLLDGAVAWLLRQKLGDTDGSAFPYWVGPGIRPEPARAAWCYGDPGVAAALLCAARYVGEPAWEREAIAIARRAGQRPFKDSGVVDAGLCHGAAGLAHVFHRLYQATGDGQLGEAARRWFQRALDMRQPDRGIAGFSAWMPNAEGEQRWVADPCFLTGAAGIALALLATITPVEPSWDRVLLASAPPRGT